MFRYDADSVLSIDEEEYRSLFPYPYFHYLPAITNLSDRPDLLAPTHLFRNIFLFAIFFCCLRFLLVRFLFKVRVEGSKVLSFDAISALCEVLRNH